MIVNDLFRPSGTACVEIAHTVMDTQHNIRLTRFFTSQSPFDGYRNFHSRIAMLTYHVFPTSNNPLLRKIILCFAQDRCRV